jgi:hypothetical protein
MVLGQAEKFQETFFFFFFFFYIKEMVAEILKPYNILERVLL